MPLIQCHILVNCFFVSKVIYLYLSVILWFSPLTIRQQSVESTFCYVRPPCLRVHLTCGVSDKDLASHPGHHWRAVNTE